MLARKKLLILACSQRKRVDVNLLPAIKRYDGGSFKVLRKAKQDRTWNQKLDVLVLSAKYGLIDACTLIHYYDQKMIPSQAQTLKPEVTEVLKSYAKQNNYDEIYVDLGQNYISAIAHRYFPIARLSY